MSSSNYYRQHDKNRISLCYLNDFVADLRCASDLLDMKLYPDAKEVSESMGLYNATFFSLLKKIDDVQDVDGIVVVGDGATPRTAAMFALRNAKWSVYSIDPMMRLSSEVRSITCSCMHPFISTLLDLHRSLGQHFKFNDHSKQDRKRSDSIAPSDCDSRSCSCVFGTNHVCN